MINIYDFKIAHPETFKQLSVKDLLFVYYRCPQEERLMQLYNHYNLILFTLGGERVIHLGEKSWTASKETSVFQGKTAYVQELLETPDWEVLAFYIPDEFLKQFANEFREHLSIKTMPAITKEIMIEINLNDAIRTYFYSMIPFFTQKLPPSEKLLELKFKELLLNILTNPLNKELLAYIINLSDNFKTPIWQVMENNYMFNLKLSEFAQISSRSLASFKREFYEHYQTTPGKWLARKRLERAKMLLETTKSSISEIAFNSGYENMSHFSRVFKEYFGSSPNQFKKKLDKVSL